MWWAAQSPGLDGGPARRGVSLNILALQETRKRINAEDSCAVRNLENLTDPGSACDVRPVKRLAAAPRLYTHTHTDLDLHFVSVSLYEQDSVSESSVAFGVPGPSSVRMMSNIQFYSTSQNICCLRSLRQKQPSLTSFLTFCSCRVRRGPEGHRFFSVATTTPGPRCLV